MSVLMCIFLTSVAFFFGVFSTYIYIRRYLKSQERHRSQVKIQQLSAWVAEIKGDPEFGGRYFERNLELSRKAINQYGSMGLKTALSDGLGSNPELVRFVFKIARDLRAAGFLRHD